MLEIAGELDKEITRREVGALIYWIYMVNVLSYCTATTERRGLSGTKRELLPLAHTHTHMMRVLQLYSSL